MLFLLLDSSSSSIRIVKAMFDPTVTTDMHSFITQLGDVRLRDLIGSSNRGYRYGYIGTEDRMMYPLIMPGAIVEIDEQRKEITRRLCGGNSNGPSTFWKPLP